MLEVRNQIFHYLKKRLGDKFRIAMHAVDQVSHFVWGAGITAAAVLFGMDSQIGMVVLPMLAILPREFVDQWPIEHPLDTIIDIICFGLGGLAVMGVMKLI